MNTSSLPAAPVAPAAPLSDADIERLEALLDSLPEPLQPLDVSALDGYLCGVVLQPRPVPADAWLPHAIDIEGRPAPAGPAVNELRTLLRRRHAEIDAAISQRGWFDPWIYQLSDDDAADADDAGDDSGKHGHESNHKSNHKNGDADDHGDSSSDSDSSGDSEGASPAECVLPWVAGFAAAMETFPALMDMPQPELVEPLALLFMHFDADDLEDADALLAVIDTLEPPRRLDDAVQDIVRALMLIADVSRPRSAQGRQPSDKAGKGGGRTPPPARHGPPGGYRNTPRRGR